MAHPAAKKLIQIDMSIDIVCPWCFVGNKNLEKAMLLSKEQFDFELRYHPFFLNPDAPKEGILKSEFYLRKFGPLWARRAANMAKIFGDLGYEMDTAGMVGNTSDSHRLIQYARTQGLDKQHALVEELFLNYHVQGKHIGDKGVLAEAAAKVGIVGAVEFLENPENGAKEVYEDLDKYSSGITGVPYFIINGKINLSGGQPPEALIGAFKSASS